jgi:hypothetical protein
MTKPLKVVFAPGCFDTFEGTQEELDSLIAEINAAVESGEFLENSVPMEESDLTEEELESLLNQLNLNPVNRNEKLN